MFYQVTAERIVTSFLFALLLRPFILHVAPVSGPNHSSKQIRENAAIDPYGLRVKVEFVVPVEKGKGKKKKSSVKKSQQQSAPRKLVSAHILTSDRAHRRRLGAEVTSRSESFSPLNAP